MAIVPEQFFEKVLAHRLIPGPLSFGWAYWPGNDGTRFWLRTRWSGTGLSEVEEVLVRLLLPLGHRFFIPVKPPVILMSEAGVPSVSLDLGELQCAGSGIQVVPSDEGAAVSAAASAYLRQSRVRSARPKGPGIRMWLDSQERAEVADIFVSRCILNGFRPDGFPGGAVDVDAIHLTGPERRLEFVEFKRKDSAARMHLPYDGAPYRLLLKTALRYNRKPEEEVKSAFRQLFARDGSCFGLDSDSHAPNVEFCFRHQIQYRYLIWDQSPKTALSELLDRDYRPLRPALRLKLGLIVPDDFQGIAYTPPSESTSVGQDGAETDMVRTQMMLDSRSVFDECQLSAELEVEWVRPLALATL